MSLEQDALDQAYREAELAEIDAAASEQGGPFACAKCEDEGEIPVCCGTAIGPDGKPMWGCCGDPEYVRCPECSR